MEAELHKFDRVLLRCMEQISRYWDGNVWSGAVGAAVILPDGRTEVAISYKRADLRWVHAERHAFDRVIRKFGSVPAGCKLVTTLSPCYAHMGDRVGCSCSDLVDHYGVDYVYAAIDDHMQREQRVYHPNYVVEITKDRNIAAKAAWFLEQIPPIQE